MCESNDAAETEVLTRCGVLLLYLQMKLVSGRIDGRSRGEEKDEHTPEIL